jgi:hypothetical protein
MAWQPQEAPMRELAGYLQDSLGSDRAAQLRATQVEFSSICLATFELPNVAETRKKIFLLMLLGM